MSSILGPDGQVINQSVLREPQTAKLDWIKRQFPLHPSRGLTPMRLYQTLDMAERGYLREQAELFVDMEEKDTHIFAELQKRKRALLTLDWSIEPPPKPSAEEEAAAELLEELVCAIPNFEDVIVDALDAIGHGFAALEIEWQRQGKFTLPKAITHRPQSWFVTDQETKSQILLRRSDSFDGVPLLPFGWVLHIHKAKSGYIARGGLLRVLTLPYLYRNYAARDFAEFLEIFGLPLRLGKYPTGTDEADKMALLDAVVQLGHDAAGIIPDDMALEFQEAAKGSGDPFMAMIDWAERSISKAVLGGTLTSGADGKSSTNALGNVHNEVRHDLKVSDARQLESTLQRQLLFPLLALNGAAPPDLMRMPRFKFDTREPGDLKQYAESLPNLVRSGMKIGLNWAHDKLMIPQAEEGEEILVAPVEKSAAPAKGELKPAEKDAQLRMLLAALTGRPGSGNGGGKHAVAKLFADQAALDKAMDDLDGGALDEAMRALLTPFLEKLTAAGSPDDVLELIAQLYPQMDAAQLREQLTRVIFVSELWGMANGDA